MQPIYYDTETCGFHGPTILIQWAEGDGEIYLHEVFREQVSDTLKLIETIIYHPGGVVGFNLSFDHFHLCQTYNTLAELPGDAYPEDIIDKYAIAEQKARKGPCLKVQQACDLMLVARRGPYQSTMERGDIVVRRVPTPLAHLLANELERRIPLKAIYFAKAKDKYAKKWKVYDIHDDNGDIIPDFKDIVLKFKPSSALKSLAVDALDLPVDTTLLFADIEVSKRFKPEEYGYAPYALAIGEPGNWKGSWPDVISHHIRHWAYNTLARTYAAKDVEYTRGLYKFFGEPELGDDDSELACMVGACRWKGYKIDFEGIKELQHDALIRKGKYPTAPSTVKKYLAQSLDPTEAHFMKGSTKKVNLETIAKWINQECDSCDGSGKFEYEDFVESCERCNGTGRYDHPAAKLAQNVLDARMAGKELELYQKLLTANRFHADFKVIGALSGRMSGNSQLNAQGIKREKVVRSKFPLADCDNQLCGGDFASFEVVLAEAKYNDPNLRRDLQLGKKIHGLFGVFVYPHMTYEEIIADKEIYTRCKSAVFAMLYGGNEHTLQERLGVDIETATKAYEQFCREYPGVAIARQRIIDKFSALHQPRGIGTQVEWKDPDDYVESMLGFRRYFTLENKIIKALYELAQDPPKEWRDLKMKFTRRDREQTASGATQTALYGAAFALQGSNIRAAANHEIQSSGAQITKTVQRKIWDLQPKGINDWVVQPMNVHDEIMCPTRPDKIKDVTRVVVETVESFRDRVPLIEIEWEEQMSSWAEK